MLTHQCPQCLQLLLQADQSHNLHILKIHLADNKQKYHADCWLIYLSPNTDNTCKQYYVQDKISSLLQLQYVPKKNEKDICMGVYNGSPFADLVKPIYEKIITKS